MNTALFPPLSPIRPAALLLVFLFGAGLCMGWSSPCHAQDTSRKRFARWIYQDLTQLPRDMTRRSALHSAGALSLVAASSLLDRSVDRALRGDTLTTLAEVSEALEWTGGPQVNALVLGTFAVSLFSNRSRFQDAAFTSLQSLLYAGATGYVLKAALGRKRPEEVADPFRFDPSLSNASFPSGHATAIAAIITPWMMYYRNPVVLGVGGVAFSGVFLARIIGEKHWASDMVAGTVLGFATARWLTLRHMRTQALPSSPRRLSLSVTPGVGRIHVALRWSMDAPR